jgi:hypothetical protein
MTPQNDLDEKRASWTLGLMSGWFLAGAFATHSWSLVPLALIGAYGLLDIKGMNERRSRR